MRDRALFETLDEQAERDADARAEASARAGRTISNGAVKRWLASWGTDRRLPPPRVGE